jgi:hypothetical protein
LRNAPCLSDIPPMAGVPAPLMGCRRHHLSTFAPWSTPPAGAVDFCWDAPRPDASTSAIARSAGQGTREARRGTRSPLVRASTVALCCFPLLPNRFPSFPPLAAWVGMPVNRHE